MPKNDPKLPKWPKNYPKWPKNTQNGPKISTSYKTSRDISPVSPTFCISGLATEVKTKMQYAGGAGWKQAKQMFESRCRCRVAVLANREQNNMQEQQSLGQNESKPTKLAANELLAIVDHQSTALISGHRVPVTPRGQLDVSDDNHLLVPPPKPSQQCLSQFFRPRAISFVTGTSTS